MTNVLPLAGRRIVVTRSADQADSFAEALRRLGAEPIRVPSIRSAPADDQPALQAAAESLGQARWLGFTSPSGVRYGWNAVANAFPNGLPDSLGVAAVGPGTRAALERLGVTPNFLPSQSTGDLFADELPVDAGDRIVLMRSNIARKAVAKRLRKRGADVLDAVAYRTIVQADPEQVASALEQQPDAVTFTSPSTVRGFFAGAAPGGTDQLRARLQTLALFPIGPVTARAVTDAGLEPTSIPDRSNIDGLIDLLVELYGA